MTNVLPNTDPNPATPRPLSIRVLGVGGAGCNAVGHLAGAGLEGVSFVALNTDAAALSRSPVAQRFTLGAKSTRGLGAGGDPVRGRMAAEEDAAEITKICEGADVVFVVAGLGGGTGTGGGPVVAQIAKDCGALVLAIVILPFECEGGRRQRQAQLGLLELKKASDGVICLSNQRVFKMIDEKTSLLEAFQITNEFIAQGVRGIWQLLMRPGLINVDFADLCSVTEGRHSESTLVTAEARGENRGREVVERLMAHPLVEGGQALTDAGAVLICIAGGGDLTMAEVNRIMEQVSRQCDQAHIIMGAAIDPAMADRLAVTLLASRGGILPEPAVITATASSVPPAAADLADHLMGPEPGPRPAPRFLPPPPTLTPEQTERLLNQQNAARPRRSGSKLRQGQLPLEIVTRGRFEKSEPTIHKGQDLDVPTYLRRGVALN
ncbi:MAG TPA: cell division protein FtsZ [Verrucomicrobiae bacterium]|nr:cell division protein FtsZ [Verrucomicrobiae bacterium]